MEIKRPYIASMQSWCSRSRNKLGCAKSINISSAGLQIITLYTREWFVKRHYGTIASTSQRMQYQ